MIKFLIKSAIIVASLVNPVSSTDEEPKQNLRHHAMTPTRRRIEEGENGFLCDIFPWEFWCDPPVPGWFQGASGASCTDTCADAGLSGMCNAAAMDAVDTLAEMQALVNLLSVTCEGDGIVEGEVNDELTPIKYPPTNFNGECYYGNIDGLQTVCDFSSTENGRRLCCCGSTADCAAALA